MQPRYLKKRQGISLKRLKNCQITKKLTQNILQGDLKQDQGTSLKRVNSLQNNMSVKRAKTTLHTRIRSNIQDISSKQNNPHLHHKTMPVKFTKIPLNSPISMNHDQNVQKLVQQITPKSQCFYKFGFKSYQKPSHKRVFSDMLNIPKQDMKGVLFIGELWNNEMTNKFMKANNVNLSKRKLFEKLRDMKWQKAQKQKQRILDSRQLISSVRSFNQRSQKSIQSFQQLSQILSLNNMTLDNIQEDLQNSAYQSDAGSRRSCKKAQFQEISRTFKQSMNKIRASIDQEFKHNKNHQQWKMMKGLKKQSHQIHKLWDNYFTKMVQNQ